MIRPWLVVMIHRRLNGRASQYTSQFTASHCSSPFHRATSVALTTSTTQHVRPPGFCHCWSVRLDCIYPVRNPNLNEAAFRRPLNTFCSHDTSAGNALYESTH